MPVDQRFSTRQLERPKEKKAVISTHPSYISRTKSPSTVIPSSSGSSRSLVTATLKASSQKTPVISPPVNGSAIRHVQRTQLSQRTSALRLGLEKASSAGCFSTVPTSHTFQRSSSEKNLKQFDPTITAGQVVAEPVLQGYCSDDNKPIASQVLQSSTGESLSATAKVGGWFLSNNSTSNRNQRCSSSNGLPPKPVRPASRLSKLSSGQISIATRGRGRHIGRGHRQVKSASAKTSSSSAANRPTSSNLIVSDGEASGGGVRTAPGYHTTGLPPVGDVSLPKSSGRHRNDSLADEWRHVLSSSDEDSTSDGQESDHSIKESANEDSDQENGDFDEDSLDELDDAEIDTVSVASTSVSLTAICQSDVVDKQPALTQSLFPNVSPTINFVTDGFAVERLPWELRRMLKWKFVPITPNVIKSTLARSHFKPSRRNYEWLGTWGKHLKTSGFRGIREHQKINHFPGSFQLGRKDRLWRNLSQMQQNFGRVEFNFFPPSFILPQELAQLRRIWLHDGNRKWIIKPPASARGNGIRLVNRWHQIPQKKPVLVQRYLSKPYLINGSKFDLRIYVFVSCFEPLKIWIHENGLVRFASVKYSSSSKHIGNRYMHLTNYSVNKKNEGYKSNQNGSQTDTDSAHKWSLTQLWEYLRTRGVHVGTLWESIKDIVIKTIISAEGHIVSMIRSSVRSRYSVYELFGFDIFIDERLKPWLIEVNVSPSLHSNSPLDLALKGEVVKDLLNIEGIMIPERQHVTGRLLSAEVRNRAPVNENVMNRRLFSSVISPDERHKQVFYVSRATDPNIQATLCDRLTPFDMRHLIEAEDELSRCGRFQRVFPTHKTHRYLRLMEQQRYSNLLLDAWVTKYHNDPIGGQTLLENLCSRGYHLIQPSDVLKKHRWAMSDVRSTSRTGRRSSLDKDDSLKQLQIDKRVDYDAQ